MKKKIILIIINIFFVVSCVKTKSRQPISSDNNSFLSTSAYRNIDIQKKQKMIFLKIIEEDSKSKYIISNKGFWFKILKSSKKTFRPKSGDEVEFFYNIFDIKGNDIYNDDNLKPVKYIIDKETAPFALMYVASEGVYQAIMNSDKEFTKLAREKNVVIVSPNTIFGFLKTYRLFIDNKEMSEKADTIQKEFAKIYEEITVFAERFSTIDKRNNQLSEDFRKLQISIDKISRRSERVKDLEFENSLGEDKKIGNTK